MIVLRKIALNAPVSSSRLRQCLQTIVFLVLAQIPLLNRADNPGHALITSYSGSETGLHEITFASAQDRDGVLYFGSTALLTFDGDRWRSFPVPNSYAIRSLDFGNDGRLWAGTTSDLGWFERTASAEWVFKSLRSLLPGNDPTINDVWGVKSDPDGATFVSVSQVVRWNGRTLETWLKASEGKFHPLELNGKFYVHNFKEGLFELDSSGPRPVLPGGTVGESGILWLDHQDNEWLLGTSQGIFKYDGKTLRQFAPDLVKFLDVGRITCGRRLPDGRIAIGTARNGLALVRADGTVESIFTDPALIPSLYITSLFVSRDGELWVTTGSHILRVDLRARSSVFDLRSGLPRQTYRMITKAAGRIYVANESGVYGLSSGQTQFQPIAPLRGRWVHIRGDSAGVIVSGFRGAFRWDGKFATPLYESRTDARTTAEPNGSTEKMLISDLRSIVLRSAGGAVQTVVEKLPGLTHSMLQDADGRIWIGTLGRGLFVATPDPDRPVEAKSAAGISGLPKLTGPVHVRRDRVGRLVVMGNNGAWQKDDTSPEFVPVANFPARNISAASEITENGDIWIAHENTLTSAPCIGRISLGSRPEWNPYPVDGLLEIGMPRSLYVDANEPGESILWIGGTHAVLRHVIENDVSIIAPRPPLLRAFMRDSSEGERAPIRGALRYAPDHIELEFAAPEFSRRALLRIETRIDGIDRDWTPLEQGSRRELTAVRDGHYTVRARVVAETGATSPEATFAFDVLPPFWRKPPFLIGAGALLVPLCFGLYLLRVRQLKKHNLELEQKVRERTEELVAANAAKTQFVANMSHDIRNPLNGIVGVTLALEDTSLAPRQREMVATLRECTTYLSSLVDDVLDFASIEAGKVELRPRAYSPAELLRSIVATMTAEALSSGATLSVAVDPALPENLFGDAGRIQQILINFVSNALKYAGGAIELSARAPADSPEEIEFAVTDRGPGISQEEQAKLFTKFTRLHPQRGGEEIPGTGLGLASCRLLADIMSGSVGVVSAPGEGARFILRLPIEVADEAVETAAVDLPNTAVLLVEDTDYNAIAATAVLSRLGLTCERARTGAEALERFAEKRFNVVLLDRNLPDMDGTEVARRMRELESDGSRAVLLAVTAYCTAQDRELCLEAGMDAFVGKPLTPDKLRRILLSAGRRLLAAPPALVSSESAGTRIDVSLLSYISDGTPAGLGQQFDLFLSALDQIEAEIIAAAADGACERLRTGAHRMQGQAKMIDASALCDVALELETAALSAEIAHCRNLLPRVRAEIQGVTEAMRHHRRASHSV